MMLRTIVHFIIAAICFVVLVYWAEIKPLASFIIGFIMFLVLDILSVLEKTVKSYPVLPCSYKAEIMITPYYRQLMNHEFVKGYYEKALPKVNREDILINSTQKEIKDAENLGEHSLWMNDNLRFLIINNLFWSNYHKTFSKKLRCLSRILDYDLSEEEQEPNLDIEIKNGLLRFWFSSPKIWPEMEYKLICEFPLFIYVDMPSEILDMRYGSEAWQNYLSLRKLSLHRFNFKKMEKRDKIRSEILAEYGFNIHSEDGDEKDLYKDRDGDTQIYDYNEGFIVFENEYFTIKIKEYLDEM